MVQHQVQYVRFATVGSAARKPVSMTAVKKTVLPKPRKKLRTVVYVDPVAVLGILVAAFMMVTMIVGLVDFAAARQEAAVMEQYVEQLSEQNRQLQQTYESGYDLEVVENTALALGMVPKDQVETVTIYVSEPQQTETITLWTRIGTFLTGLFA
ncbi:MAG: hypothetical protein IJO04_00560 [Oscillospiraceae bacterium]|nr:hypothetical protein [Oscillospiraceae bacterium]